jgi:hypothetical protein
LLAEMLAEARIILWALQIAKTSQLIPAQSIALSQPVGRLD